MSDKRTISVVGMSCSGCEANVEESLADVEGVEAVAADAEAGTVEVSTEESVADSDLADAVNDAGYAVEE